MAGQEQALRTNAVKCYIDKIRSSGACRMCKREAETSAHLVSGCEKMTQKEYKRRHDRVATQVHWYLCKRAT